MSASPGRSSGLPVLRAGSDEQYLRCGTYRSSGEAHVAVAGHRGLPDHARMRIFAPLALLALPATGCSLYFGPDDPLPPEQSPTQPPTDPTAPQPPPPPPQPP